MMWSILNKNSIMLDLYAKYSIRMQWIKHRTLFRIHQGPKLSPLFSLPVSWVVVILILCCSWLLVFIVERSYILTIIVLSVVHLHNCGLSIGPCSIFCRVLCWAPCYHEILYRGCSVVVFDIPPLLILLYEKLWREHRTLDHSLQGAMFSPYVMWIWTM